MAKLTQRAIMREFEDMLSEMPFSKITVTALVARCEISSNTFYYHFHDIYHLMQVWLEQKKTTFLSRRKPAEKWDDTLKAFLHALKEHPKLVYHVSDSITREQLERFVFVSVKNLVYEHLRKIRDDGGYEIDEEVLNGLTDFCCYYFLGLTLEFVWGHMESDPDAAVDRMKTIFDGIIQNAGWNPEQGRNSPT